MKFRCSSFYLLILHILFFWHSALEPAIPASTYVDTAHGPRLIESLDAGDAVLCFDTDKDTIKETAVVAVTPELVRKLVVITTVQGKIRFSSKQLLFDPVHAQWIKAARLTQNHYLLNSVLQQVRCLQVKKRMLGTPHTAYHLSLKDPHTFFCTEQSILAHNTLITIAMAAPRAVPVALKVGVAIGGIAYGIWKFATGSGSGGGGGANWIPSFFPPPDPNDPNSNTFIWFTKEIFKKAFKYATTDAKLTHFFGSKSLLRHNFINFLSKFRGNQLKAVREILLAAHGKIPKTEGELFKIIVTVYGESVHIWGIVMDGIPKISTMFIETVQKIKGP